MPIYEYKCTQCSHLLELFENSTEEHNHICPSCNDPNSLKKIISLSSFKLKGSGWFKTVKES
jgi:putative FmdB family regulatory protein